MRGILGVILCGITLICQAQLNPYDSRWLTDTLTFNTKAIVLSIPEKSIELSCEQIFKGEGNSFIYPLKISFTSEGKWNVETLVIEQIVNTSYERLISNGNVDIELWNTFNHDYEGSRCYITSELYTRIDILSSGLVIVYENLSPEIAKIADRIISTIRTINNNNLNLNKDKRKRRVKIID